MMNTMRPSLPARRRIGRVVAIAVAAAASVAIGNIALSDDGDVSRLASSATAVPCSPVAIDDVYTITQDQTLVVGAPGVTGNDDTCGGMYGYPHLFDGPSNGSLQLNNDGSFTYTPNAGFVGTDSFVYSLQDFPMGWRRAGSGLAPQGAPDRATVTITVTEPATPTTQPGATTPTITTPTETTGPSPGTTSGEVTACSDVPTPGPLDGEGHAQVIAQGVVEFGEGSLAWSHQPLAIDEWPFLFESAPPAFYVGDGPEALLVSTAGQPWALLDAGEGAFVPAGESGMVDVLLDNGIGAGHRITFVAGSGPDAFTPGAGLCDVNVVRDILQSGETLVVTSLYPVLVVVTDGAVVDGHGTGVELAAGEVATIGGSLELRNDGDEPATVLVAAIGSGVPAQ